MEQPGMFVSLAAGEGTNWRMAGSQPWKILLASMQDASIGWMSPMRMQSSIYYDDSAQLVLTSAHLRLGSKISILL